MLCGKLVTKELVHLLGKGAVMYDDGGTAVVLLYPVPEAECMEGNTSSTRGRVQHATEYGPQA